MGTSDIAQLAGAGGAGPKKQAGDMEVWAPLFGVATSSVRANAAHEMIERTLEIEGHRFEIQIIRWESRPAGEEAQLHLLNPLRMAVFSAPSPIRSRWHFHTWTFVSSTWAEDFSATCAPSNPEARTPASPTWTELLRQLHLLGESIHAGFIHQKAEVAVRHFETDGFFPAYESLDHAERAWRLQHTREMVRQIYMAEPRVFDGGTEHQAKIIIRLLDRLAVSNENGALLEVLNGVLDMDGPTVQRLAEQLRLSSMEHIVAAIEVLQRRATAVQQLRHLMDKHHRDVLETPDLQRIIENNTWLFGPQYETIGAEDDTFSEIAKRVRDDVLGRTGVDMEDVDSADDLPGARRQADLFLARKLPTFDSMGRQIFKFIVIEIKRPSIALNRKHLRQLEEYADVIKSMSIFESEVVHFELLLVGHRISRKDQRIRSRLQGNLARGEHGLIEDSPRMKLYVMNWGTLLNSFELTNSFMLEKLRMKRAELEGETKAQLVAELQQLH
ncbi:hypothetical protein [Mitsuaria sp. GD03876]|uniref:hypothetical protein n=1 Tax=Mitsuaria sp. GD03876 TaxID=2975399 RepID=UPI00244C4ECE|nr:hypothetical protein [Mitsuaria sp. GD03876]MDH0863230.1 hypothetical protein [Mitsuaria sp. GD03876]